ncbi:hypothetical protein LTR56_025473 [Elasticomyces elasticus]|nr:hypothetical protein LTR56_025473 [Elasticomyces elasticus]KAK3627189.1 hypothetical protein LTR22_022871 [Elasticomyces elasticus]KAK4907455.1 hypothetical protein LTR49_023519 [Elasticomyces elasticus]
MGEEHKRLTLAKKRLTPNTLRAIILVLVRPQGMDFVPYTRAAKVFSKPLVVKEDFSNRGMHTAEQFLMLLQRSFP